MAYEKSTSDILGLSAETDSTKIKFGEYQQVLIELLRKIEANTRK